MTKLANYTIALSLLLAGSASAADMRMPVKAAPAPVSVAAYSWTGCYVGAGGGYGMYNQEIDPRSGGVILPGFSDTKGGRGWFGTVQVGCDYQVGSNIVIGAFADYDFGGLKGDITVSPFNYTGHEKLKSSWAAGGRIGFVPFQSQQLLVYVSGGWTEARFGQTTFTNSLYLPKTTFDGWFLGTGYEYGIGFLPGLFWKTEYRFADYGKENLLILTSGGAPTGTSVDTEKRVQTIRSELVWRFNFGGPVVARY